MVRPGYRAPKDQHRPARLHRPSRTVENLSQLKPPTIVELESAPIARFGVLLDAGRQAELEKTMGRLAQAARGRAIWNVNSTAHGGGVAEMLAALIPYSRGSGIDERWAVIEGSPEFFEVTKKLHSLLHGVVPPETGLSERDRIQYEATTKRNAASLLELVRPGDWVILHDPQTAGLIPHMRALGTRVVWRSHIGADHPNEAVRGAWNFLLPYVQEAHAVVFSRRAYTWEVLEGALVAIIPPVIDPFTAKNRDLSEREVDSIMKRESLPDRPRMVLQVSRWDRLKDPDGVLEGFAAHVADRSDAWLALAGPAVASVSDDPEQPEVFGEVTERVARLPAAIRDRIVIAQLQMEDVERNALAVNALQRRAEVVVQKSLAEGFGLTVAEAMWKSRPVVASRVGGIPDQIDDGDSGLLVDDPRDLEAFGDAVVSLLDDPQRAAALGAEGRRKVGREFITPRHLVRQARLLLELDGK